MVERFQAMVDGDIRRWPGDEKTPKGRRKAKRATVLLKAVQALRPARNEIIMLHRNPILGFHRDGPPMRAQG